MTLTGAAIGSDPLEANIFLILQMHLLMVRKLRFFMVGKLMVSFNRMIKCI